MNAEMSVPVERIMALHTVARVWYVAPPLLLIFGWAGGWLGLWSSALGIGIVVANFLLAGAIMSISARISLQAYHAAAVIGFFLRLGLLVGAIYVIVALFDVDRLALGISAVVSYLTLLTLEAVAVSKRGRESNWTS